MAVKMLKKNVKTVKTLKPKKAASYVVIDYPTQSEVINSSDYTIRIGAPEDFSVEISINYGDWQSCRYSVGFWWFDWGNYNQGLHNIVARIKNSKGKVIKKSTIRTCQYITN